MANEILIGSRIFREEFLLDWKTKNSLLRNTGKSCKHNILQISRNFSAIAWQVTHCYLLLYKYFHSLLRKDVSYMDPIIQNENNELISIIAKYIFQKWIFLQTKLLVCMCMCVCVLYIYIYIYVDELMKQWWMVAQLETALRYDTT